MQASYSYKNSEKIVDIRGTAERVIRSSFTGTRGDYCIATLPMLLRELGRVEIVNMAELEAIEKAIRVIIAAGVKALTIVKLGKNVWDFTAWMAQSDLDLSEKMIQFYETQDDKADMMALFNRDHEEASQRLVAAIARYSQDYYMPETVSS